MRPYLAIIWDSFREALASRVLWILLLLIALLLIGLAPLGVQETATRRLTEDSVPDLPRFLLHLRDEQASDAPSPAKKIASLLPAGMRQKLLDFKIPEHGQPREGMRFPGQLRELREALNGTLTRADFHDKESWGKVRFDLDELRSLMKRDVETLLEEELSRRNLLLLEAAFSDFIQPTPAVSLTLRYLWKDLTPPLPVHRAEFTRQMESLVAFVIGWLIGVLGVFIALLVTSSIIPQTFDPGSLNLLLSKPIRRSFLFLAKFLGGCAFIFLSGCFLVGGVWLILGWRFHLWLPKLLWTIPVYTFVFSIYYTVSALAGVIWRNAIVSIVLSCLFWAACFGVGLAKVFIEEHLLSKLRVVRVISAGDDVVAVNELTATFRWNGDANEWLEIFEPKEREDLERRIAIAFMPSVPAEIRPVGPIYDPRGEQLIAAARSFRSGQMPMNVGKRASGWKNVRGANASLGTQALLVEADGGVLVVSSLGLFRLEGDPTIKAGPVKMFGFNLPLPAAGPFRSVGPEPALLIARPSAAALDGATGELVIFSRGTITILKRDDSGNYARKLEKKLEIEPSESVVMTAGGGRILVGRKDGSVTVYDAEKLEPQDTRTLDAASSPRFVTASKSGRFFAVTLHNGSLWLYDANRDANRDGESRFTRPPVKGQGDVSVADFSNDDRLLVADRTTRVTEYDPASLAVTRSFAPTMSLLESVYRYGISPLYYVFPKPGELDKTVQYFLSGKETVETGPGKDDQTAAQKNLHPWRPVVSSLAFMFVVLLLGCVYLERQDF